MLVAVADALSAPRLKTDLLHAHPANDRHRCGHGARKRGRTERTGKRCFRVQIYTGLGTSSFDLIGARMALEQPQEDLAAANAEWQRHPRRDASAARRPSGCPSGRRLVAAPRRHRARARLRRGLRSPAREEGRRHADACLAADCRSSRPLRVQQLVSRTAGTARRPRPPGTRRRELSDRRWAELGGA